MASILDTVRAALKRPKSSTAQLADAVEQARKADVEARAAVDKAAAVVANGFMDETTKRAADRAVLAAARETAEDTALVLGQAEKLHAAAVAAAEQDRRRMLYESAAARADEAVAELAKDYPALVKNATKMLRAPALAQRDVEVANRDLPDGVAPIADPEHIARGIPSKPKEILKSEEVVRWTRFNEMTPVDEPHHSEIVKTKDGWGIHPGNVDRTPDLESTFLQARFVRREVRQHVNGVTPQPLGTALRLPALTGDGLAWGVADGPGASSTLLATMAGQATPDVVLHRLQEMDAAPTRPGVGNGDVTVEWEMLGYVGATPLMPASEDYRRNPDERPKDAHADNDPAAPVIRSGLVGLPGLRPPSFTPIEPIRLVPLDGSSARLADR